LENALKNSGGGGGGQPVGEFQILLRKVNGSLGFTLQSTDQTVLKHTVKVMHISVLVSVVNPDPDPKESEPFCKIRIRIRKIGRIRICSRKDPNIDFLSKTLFFMLCIFLNFVFENSYIDLKIS